MRTVVLGFLLFAASWAPALAERIQFAIVPQQAAARLAEMWTPLLRELSARSGVEIEFVTAPDIPSFEACLAAGAYEMAYMNPFHFTVFNAAPGYHAFARQADARLKGLIVARKDGAVTRLEDLDGATVGFPSPAAFGATVIPRADMALKGLTVTPRYLKSHDSVYRAVAAGLIPAGGGVLRTFRALPDEIRDQLTVIYETAAYTPHAFARRADVPDETAQAILAAMLEVQDARPELVREAGFNAFEAAADADWDDVRGLRLAESGAVSIATEAAVTCHSD